MFDAIITRLQSMAPGQVTISLHEPQFQGNEKKYLLDVVDSTFVSYLGPYVNAFENAMAEYVGAKHAIAMVNGTCALHMALILAGVGANDEVITQPLTFVATCNAIQYCGAVPIFVDVEPNHFGMSVDALREYLETHADRQGEYTVNKLTGRVMRACLPMHTLGHPSVIDEILSLCEQYHIKLIEDAAESLGSFYKGQHTGTFGSMGVLSFNGNKIITSGGGGMLVTNDDNLAARARHLSTTAKENHPWAYYHDELGYNYRMPNLNAALGLAQLEQLPGYLDAKRGTMAYYKALFADQPGMHFISESKDAKCNAWLNAVRFDSKSMRDAFINACHDAGISVRPVWELMTRLPMYESDQPFPNAERGADTLVCLPSSVSLGSRLSSYPLNQQRLIA